MPRAAINDRRRGRTGRRTALTVQVARERIRDLFELAERESRRRGPGLADRYVALARKIGTRYNVRLPEAYRASCCRHCSAYWIEGRTVRTRIRPRWRVRTCLACGAVRRTAIRARPGRGDSVTGPDRLVRPPEEGALVEDAAGFDEEGVETGGEEPE